MILVASQRSGAMDLATHLLKEENEHVEIHEVRGFVSDDVKEAFKESEALAKGTRCSQHLFSLSLNPPEKESVAVEVFEKAISDIEEKLKLKGQPRIVIFHEKEGRRHAHCVWSRIDIREMKAVHLPHYKQKLMGVSKRLYLEHGWKMPEGLRSKNKRNPLNFTREEWQQAKRIGIDPKALKRTFQECWNVSDSKKAFAHALLEHGLILAQGDRRGFVAIDYRGEVYAIARYAGIKTKEAKAKLGSPDDLPSVMEAKAAIAERMSAKLRGFITETEQQFDAASKTLDAKRVKLAEYHREERQRLKAAQEKRWQEEMLKRAKRLRGGFLGIWDYLSGKNSKIQSQNSMETYWSYQRDQKERQNLIDQQLSERRVLQRQIKQVRLRHTRSVTRLHRDIGFYLRLSPERQEQILERKQPQRRRGPSLSPKM